MTKAKQILPIRAVRAVVSRWRLRQALKIADCSPDVIMALHRALRESEPKYLQSWRKMMHDIGNAVDDMNDVMEWLREGGFYEQADRVRTITGRLARIVPEHRVRHDENGHMFLIRDLARTYK